MYRSNRSAGDQSILDLPFCDPRVDGPVREESKASRSKARLGDEQQVSRWEGLPCGPYDVVLADPPWSYYGQQDKWTAAAKFYPTAPDEQIAALPMHDLLSKNGILFLWATSPRLDVAMECIKSWKLYFRGMAFVWVKARKDGKPIGAQGIRPSIIKPTAEYVIAASKVAKGRPLKLYNEGVPNVILAPKREHSQKPPEVQAHIESMYPGARRLEMFARATRPGWEAWGNETDRFDAPGYTIAAE
ncbi:MT-A70 family methyltransferase [Sphingomonas tabacisoli]|uniref:MT-A70 family methyltransferase n=1 Tax=Sphingomonas tabacisoli TaxID=2249466 RepID=A0ABW4HYD2_9SPHN